MAVPAGRPALTDGEVLLDRARCGDAVAFGALYSQLVRPVAGYLRSRGIPDVEDVTSEVFVAVLSGVGRFDGDLARFRSWVFTIAHGRSVDHWRRVGRAPEMHALDIEGDGVWDPSAEDLALERTGVERVLGLLSVLSPDQRDVLALRVVGDLTVDQVAAVLGKTSGAVKALQHRALARLRRVVSTEGVTL